MKPSEAQIKKTRHFPILDLEGRGGLGFFIYFVQNKMEQQTPITPKSRVKPREGQKLAISPSRIGGMGGLGLSKSAGF